jgi:hypothetical protein
LKISPHTSFKTILQQDSEGFLWILTVLDHFTKYLWAEAFTDKSAPPIASFLYECFTSGLCILPERWHADNGGEFKNHHIDAVREMLTRNNYMTNDSHNNTVLLKYTHSMPRNPQCQGLVERMNRTLKGGIQKLMEEKGFTSDMETFEWRPLMKLKVWNLNRADIKLYGFSPFLMVNGFPPEAPDHKPLDAETLRQLHLDCAEKMRGQALGMATKIPVRVFKRGDVVMVHQRKRRSQTNKSNIGQRQWVARAVIVNVSPTNGSYYQLRWITDGLIAKEKPGTVCTRLWDSYNLKLCPSAGKHVGDVVGLTRDQVEMEAAILHDLQEDDKENEEQRYRDNRIPKESNENRGRAGNDEDTDDSAGDASDFTAGSEGEIGRIAKRYVLRVCVFDTYK